MRLLTRIRLIFIKAIFPVLLISYLTINDLGADDWREHYESGHTKEEILKEFNLHRGKWWNYYARGRRFAEAGFCDDAIYDFHEALNVRSQDQKKARSYGMHFWNYYPHRELGVCYYNLGRYYEAVKELEESLRTVDTSKAKFYLNMARSSILALNQSDKNPPVIIVNSYKTGDYVNVNRLYLEGTVRDDHFSGDIWIDDEKQFVELAAKEVSFRKELNLELGENSIIIKAGDLAGNRISNTLKLTFDSQAPVILLYDISENRSSGQDMVTVSGTLTDNFGTNRFWINDREISVKSGNKISFKEVVDISLTGTVILMAEDFAGNVVKGAYSLAKKSSIHGKNSEAVSMITSSPYQFSQYPETMLKKYSELALADNSLNARLVSKYLSNVKDADFITANSNEKQLDKSPQIITDLKPITVYEDRYIMSIEAHDETGLKKLTINNTVIQCESAKDIYLDHTIFLKEGDNLVNISVENIAGKIANEVPIIIKKKTYEFLQTNARYAVAMMPFSCIGTISDKSNSIYLFLLKSFFKEPMRFNFVERDKERLLGLLKELKINNAEYKKVESAVKVGKIKAAEGMLFGTIAEDEKSLNITINLVDTETTNTVLTTDVYTEDKSIEGLQLAMRGLAIKVKQRFPMLHGKVIKVAKRKFFANLGKDDGLLFNMKFLVYRESKVNGIEIKDPLDVLAKVHQVDRQSCMVKMVKGDEEIMVNDLVVTK